MYHQYVHKKIDDEAAKVFPTYFQGVATLGCSTINLCVCQWRRCSRRQESLFTAFTGVSVTGEAAAEPAMYIKSTAASQHPAAHLNTYYNILSPVYHSSLVQKTTSYKIILK
jgi:hypothetical protein